MRRLTAGFLMMSLVALLCGCASTYSEPSKWLICTAGRSNTEFDVFYVHPTLVSDKLRPLMDVNDEKTLDRARRFAAAQTGIFGKNVRVFAPKVRQLEYGRVLKHVKDDPTGVSLGMLPGVEDTASALRYYLKHYNHGRPYILFGHSQGAMDIYEAMRRVPEVSMRKGFVAAYLPGLPKHTPANITADFGCRYIQPAFGEKDFGVIVCWNTQGPNVAESPFAARGTLCINPLNWRRDGIPADSKANAESTFYDHREKDPAKAIKVRNEVCGAQVDVIKGALIVELPEHGEYDMNGLLGDGIFHVSDVWLFSGALAKNASARVAAWLCRE